ncbi:MAG: recombinase family protein [Gammaproteobacteria bacterium]|nr:recombinase family protein [Gammaproteobacteria bacterium]
MNFIAYYRVSTQRQGQSGLGLESQQSIVKDYVSRQEGKLLFEYTEIESGKKSDRPKLLEALNHCQLTNSTLVVSKLDRLSRDLHFLTTVMKSNIQFLCCDQENSGTLILHVLAAVAESEGAAISERTKLALQAAKKRGVKLGNPNFSEVRNNCTKNAHAQFLANTVKYQKAIQPVIENIRAQDITTYTGIANELNKLGFKSRTGKKFYPTTVKRLLA